MKSWLGISAAFWLAGCAPDPACDPGQRYELGSCLVVAAPRDAGGSDDDGSAGTTDAGNEACRPGPGNYDGFGDSCSTDGDCRSCVAPTCATAPINRCSRVNCENDPQACPPGWSCTDISVFSTTPGVTHICLML